MKKWYEALTALDACDTPVQHLQEGTVPKAYSGYCKKKQVLVASDSPLEVIPLCQPGGKSCEIYCFLGAKIWDTVKRVP